MQVFVDENYTKMSAHALEDLLPLMQLRTDPLVCVASGHSPSGLYHALVKEVQENKLDVRHWNFISLDEWVGLNGNDEGSCRYHLDHELFKPLHTSDTKLCFFDGRAEDLDHECEKAEAFISSLNGIDVAVLGLGMNGHIGMNEPGTDAQSRAHVTELAELTKVVGQKYFKEAQELSLGITLGLGTLMEAKQVFLLVNGARKAEIVRQLFEEEVSTQLPASLFRTHRGLRIYLDKEAASLLQPHHLDGE